MDKGTVRIIKFRFSLRMLLLLVSIVSVFIALLFVRIIPFRCTLKSYGNCTRVDIYRRLESESSSKPFKRIVEDTSYVDGYAKLSLPEWIKVMVSKDLSVYKHVSGRDYFEFH